MIWLFITISSIITILLVYFIYRALYLAGALADAQDYINELENTNEFMYTAIENAYDNMQQVDTLGAFEKDDESGTTFSMLYEIVTKLKEQFNNAEAEKI
jgi:hypothetical protein